MSTEYDERALAHWRFTNWGNLVKLEQDEGLVCETLKKTMPAHLGSFFE